MRSIAGITAFLFFSTCALAGCKKPDAASSTKDASTALASATAEPEAPAARPDAGRAPIGMFGDAGGPRPRGSASAGTALPPLPVASDALELVAIGKGFNSRVLWLQTIGTRVWLSGKNLDAFAEGDGPLVKGRDPLEKLPYKPGGHDMSVVGAWPKLFALRTKRIEGRMESPEPTVFVYAAEENGPGTWKEAKPLGMSWYPHAFVAWRDGALLVSGQLVGNSAPYYHSPDPGTTLTFVGADGSVSDPKLDVHPHFLAWSASSDGDTLSLIGTVALPPKKKGEARRASGASEEQEWDASGANVLRIGKDGSKRIAIQQNLGIALETYSARVVEAGGKALVTPPPTLTAEEGWRPNGRTVFVIDGDKLVKRAVAGDESCTVSRAHLVGDVLWAVRVCYASDASEELVRVSADGKTEKITMPRLVKADTGGFRVAKTDADKKRGLACVPTGIVVRGNDDVWINGRCGGGDSWGDQPHVPIVLRRGRAQEPIVLP